MKLTIPEEEIKKILAADVSAKLLKIPASQVKLYLDEAQGIISAEVELNINSD